MKCLIRVIILVAIFFPKAWSTADCTMIDETVSSHNIFECSNQSFILSSSITNNHEIKLDLSHLLQSRSLECEDSCMPIKEILYLFQEYAKTMIEPSEFITILKQLNINYYTGVPDSLLKSICAYITDHIPKSQYAMAANEGNTIGLAVRYHLTMRKISLVYMQDSILGNTINPLLSLVDSDIYAIPIMLLLIGWRGDSSIKDDEPQHVKQGVTMLSILVDSMDIPFTVIDSEKSNISEIIPQAV